MFTVSLSAWEDLILECLILKLNPSKGTAINNTDGGVVHIFSRGKKVHRPPHSNAEILTEIPTRDANIKLSDPPT